ncbi:MAG: AAA family ATPase [Candidatus Thorarchaeota archaeon]
MGDDETYTEMVRLVTPEQLPSDRVGQYSVIELARDFHLTLGRFDKVKTELQTAGIEFGGRVAIIGSAGTDFEGFAFHLAKEVPLKMVRFEMSQLLGDQNRLAESLRVGMEFARRNSPCLFFIEKLDVVGRSGQQFAAVLQNELSRTSWDRNEVLIVASTSRPDVIDRDILTVFDRIHVFEATTLDDRIRVVEHVLKGREDIDPGLVAELTDGWSFTDVKHLVVSLLTGEPEAEGQVSRDKMEDIIQRSGVIATGRDRDLHTVHKRVMQGSAPALEIVNEQYPDDFLDQLYLMAVGEDYAETQRVIETLNGDLPLTTKDREFLSRYPFLLTGSTEDRLTRLLRAKKNNDRLSRIMGR